MAGPIFCYPQIIIYFINFKPTIKPSLQFPDVFKPLFLSREKTRPGKFLDFNIPSLICTGSLPNESHVQHHFKNQTATILMGCISKCLRSSLIIPACICVRFGFLANSSRNQATILVISSTVMLDCYANAQIHHLTRPASTLACPAVSIHKPQAILWHSVRNRKWRSMLRKHGIK